MLRDRGLRRTSPEKTAESLLRGATRAPSSRARGRRSRRCATGRRRGGPGARSGSPPRCCADPVAQGPRCRPSPGSSLAARVAPRRAAGPAAGRPRPPTGCAGGSCSSRRRRRRRCWWRRRARRPRDGGAVRVAQRNRRPAPPSGWCSWRGRRREVAGRSGGGGTWRSGRRTSRTCVATATGARRASTPGCCTGRRRSRRVRRRVRCDASGLTRPDYLCERHRLRRVQVPPLTRDAWLPSVQHQLLPRELPGGMAPCRKG